MIAGVRHFSLKTHGNAVGFLLLCLRLLFASHKCGVSLNHTCTYSVYLNSTYTYSKRT